MQSTSMGSWGFDVNRSTNGLVGGDQTSSSSLLIKKRTKDDGSTTITTRQRNGHEFAAIDRLVHGPNKSSPDLQRRHISRTPSNEDLTMTNAQQQWKNELIAWQSRMLEK